MKAIYFFNIGIGINLFILLISIVNYIQCANILPEYTNRYIIGILVVLLFFSGLIGLAFWLKSRNKILLANILMWLPAIPLIFCMGLALLFIIAGN